MYQYMYMVKGAAFAFSGYDSVSNSETQIKKHLRQQGIKVMEVWGIKLQG